MSADCIMKQGTVWMSSSFAVSGRYWHSISTQDRLLILPRIPCGPTIALNVATCTVLVLSPTTTRRGPMAKPWYLQPHTNPRST